MATGLVFSHRVYLLCIPVPWPCARQSLLFRVSNVEWTSLSLCRSIKRLRVLSLLLNASYPRNPVGVSQAESGEMKKGSYVDASPTVGDLDGDGRLEVLVGTVRGGLHVVDALSG